MILTPGGAAEDGAPAADDPTLAKYRIYMVRPDVTPTTPFASVQDKLTGDAKLISKWSAITAQQLYDIYVQDWNEWPAKDGLPAPYKDVNGDGKYDPAVDIPGQPGADQTLYYVANDCNAARSDRHSPGQRSSGLRCIARYGDTTFTVLSATWCLKARC